MINVTKSFLPPLEEYLAYLQEIWRSGWLTNNGPLVVRFERELKEVLKAENLSYVANGTLALQLAIRALDLKGEIITTPFSYVATCNSILWEQCQPVFADIDPESLALDPQRVEELITEKTTAILPVHVYGIPCDVFALGKLAREHNLKLIYDAAHALGVQLQGKPISQFGDVSTFSLHATKIIHSVEGGIVVCNDAQLGEKVAWLRSFGHRQDEYEICGINAKNSEFHAAMGLCVLPRLESFIQERRALCASYDRQLAGLPLTKPRTHLEFEPNYSYYPILFENETSLSSVLNALQAENIHPRRYFWPSLNQLPFVSGQVCPVSENVASRVLCLPLYVGLDSAVVTRICQVIGENLKGSSPKVVYDPPQDHTPSVSS